MYAYTAVVLVDATGDHRFPLTNMTAAFTAFRKACQ